MNAKPYPPKLQTINPEPQTLNPNSEGTGSTRTQCKPGVGVGAFGQGTRCSLFFSSSSFLARLELSDTKVYEP